MEFWARTKNVMIRAGQAISSFFADSFFPWLADFTGSPYRLLLVVLCLTLINIGQGAGLTIAADLVIVACVLRCLLIIHRNKKDDSPQAEQEESGLRSKVERKSDAPA